MANNALTLALSPEQGLQRYLSEIRKFPMLTKENEFMLAKSWQEHGDTNAAHQLVTSHLRLVAKIAMGYRGYGLPIGEVISEGNVGLMQAVKKFDPDKGFRLATYAMWWIRASIQEYILRSWSLVKMGATAAQKKLFFNLRRMKGEMAALEEGDLRPEHVATIAHKLAVTEAEVTSMNRRMSGGGDASLNAPIGGAGGEGDSEWMDWLSDDQAEGTQETVRTVMAARRPGAPRPDFCQSPQQRGSLHSARRQHLAASDAREQCRGLRVGARQRGGIHPRGAGSPIRNVLPRRGLQRTWHRPGAGAQAGRNARRQRRGAQRRRGARRGVPGQAAVGSCTC
jgi:RNA polymerase sigma-32 factor